MKQLMKMVVNSRYMGDLVFNHPEKRLELNAIIHPIVQCCRRGKEEYLNKDIM